jgi:hypothetical protein
MKNEIQALKNRMGGAVDGDIIGSSFEPPLGDPGADGYCLVSTMAGVRSWVANGGIGPDLTAIEALTGTGIAVRTAANTWAQRAIAVSGNGLNAVTNPLGIAGDPTISLNIGTGATQVAAGDHAHVGLYDALGAAAAVTPTTLGLVIGTNTQAHGAKLDSIQALASAAGWLHNDGAGAFAYSIPSYSDVGAAAAGHNHAGVYEPVLAAASPDPTLKYYRGDKSWATLNQAAVAGLTTADSPTLAGLNISKATPPFITISDTAGKWFSMGVGANDPFIAFDDTAASGFYIASQASVNKGTTTGLTNRFMITPAGLVVVAGLTASLPVVSGPSKEFASVSYATFKASLALAQADISGLATGDGPSFAHLHLADVAAIYTAAESWVGPSSTAGVYFKGGNVGIGTTAPTAKLTISGTDNNQVVGAGVNGVIEINQVYSAAYGRLAELVFSVAAPGTASRTAAISSAYTSWHASSLGGDLRFSTRVAGAANLTERMRILEGGSVLIGATTAVGSEIFRCDGNAYFDHDVSADSFTDRP